MPRAAMCVQEQVRVLPDSRGACDVTKKVEKVLIHSGVRTGLCHIFVRHTSASLMLCENTDSMVRDVLECFMQRTPLYGDPIYRHGSERPNYMMANVLSVSTDADLSVLVMVGRLAVGIWQGIYLRKHRLRPHSCDLVITL